MKEIVINFRKRKGEHAPVYINGDEIERVESFKFLGAQITNNLSWSLHADTIVKKAHQRLYFLRRLRKFDMSPTTLTNFYRCTIESILSGCIVEFVFRKSDQKLKRHRFLRKPPLLHRRRDRKTRRIQHGQGVAEEMKFEDGSVDLVTVGAAAHWFDMEKFMKELARILKPHGCVALYCYEVPHLLGYDHCSDHPTQIVQDLFTILKPYETEVNSIVWNEYKEVFDAITFPDKERAEDIYVKLKKSISWFIRYLNSSVLYQSYQKEDPENAKASLEKVEQRLLNALGVSSETVVEFSMKYFCVLASKPE
ncbi:uncharacterized protein LOC144503927 isoform X1 [Mustelus asterias]